MARSRSTLDAVIILDINWSKQSRFLRCILTIIIVCHTFSINSLIFIVWKPSRSSYDRMHQEIQRSTNCDCKCTYLVKIIKICFFHLLIFFVRAKFMVVCLGLNMLLDLWWFINAKRLKTMSWRIKLMSTVLTQKSTVIRVHPEGYASSYQCITGVSVVEVRTIGCCSTMEILNPSTKVTKRTGKT